MPTITIIMPTYNAERTIAASIASVFAQTYTDFELLIIDDCSTDSTHTIAQNAIAGRNARLLRNTTNLGVAASRNYGVSMAKGEWTAFLDSDDLWQPDKLQKQLDFMRQTGAVISYTASAFMDFDGKPYGYIMPAVPKLSYRQLLKQNLMSCSSVIVRTDIISRYKMGGDEMHEDYATWLAILREFGHAYGLDEPLLTYRLSPTSKSGNRFKSALMTFNAYRYVGYNPIMAAALTLRYAAHSIRKRHGIKKS
ncbi:glycosyl transferase [Clostridia bacterium]|nr:glycosyl transferase [Clostridia bacterium]